MEEKSIVEIVKSVYPDAEVQARGMDCNFNLIIKDSGLRCMSQMKAQQAIYKLFKKQIQTGELHALSISIE